MYLKKHVIGFLMSLFLIGNSWGQSAGQETQGKEPTPPPSASGNYQYRTEFTLGGMSTDIHGSQEKYRSDINLQSGYRLENFRLEIRPMEGSAKWFDIMTFQTRGLGDVDPHEDAQVSLRKNGKYDLRLNYSKDQYFFAVPGFALDSHSDDNLRRQIRADFRYYWKPNLILRLGYANFQRSGNSAVTQESFLSIFPLLQYHRGRTDDYRIGMDWKNRVLGISFDQGFRSLRFDDHFTALQEQGIDSASTNRLAGMDKNTPLRGLVPETTVTAKIRPSDRLDILARYRYSRGDFDFSRYELQNLRIGASGLPLEQLALTQASTNQPQHRFDLNSTYQVASQWTLQNSFFLNQYELQGGGNLVRSLRNTNLSKQTPVIVSEIQTSQNSEYRRINNETTLQFSPSRFFRLHTAYRYADRKYTDLVSEDSGVNLVENQTAQQSIIAGWSASSGLTWKTSLEYEHSWTEQPIYWMEPLRFDRWSARGSFKPFPGWQVAGSIGIRDVDNDLSGRPHNSQDFRDYSVQIGWTPRKDYLVDVSYGRADILSITDIVFQLATASATELRYMTNMNYASFLFQIPIHKKLHGQLSYQLLDDSSGSYPLVFHQTAAGLLVNMKGPLWLDLKWRYIAYNEELFHDRDYAGHLLGAGLKFGF